MPKTAKGGAGRGRAVPSRSVPSTQNLNQHRSASGVGGPPVPQIVTSGINVAPILHPHPTFPAQPLPLLEGGPPYLHRIPPAYPGAPLNTLPTEYPQAPFSNIPPHFDDKRKRTYGNLVGPPPMPGDNHGASSSMYMDEDDGDEVETRNKRPKFEIRFMPEKHKRHITFSKRKSGLMKKAYELSILTGTQVMLLVASENGHVYTYATDRFQTMLNGEGAPCEKCGHMQNAKHLIQTCLTADDDEQDADDMEDSTATSTSTTVDQSSSTPSHLGAEASITTTTTTPTNALTSTPISTSTLASASTSTTTIIGMQAPGLVNTATPPTGANVNVGSTNNSNNNLLSAASSHTNNNMNTNNTTIPTSSSDAGSPPTSYTQQPLAQSSWIPQRSDIDMAANTRVPIVSVPPSVPPSVPLSVYSKNQSK